VQFRDSGRIMQKPSAITLNNGKVTRERKRDADLNPDYMHLVAISERDVMIIDIYSLDCVQTNCIHYLS